MTTVYTQTYSELEPDPVSIQIERMQQAGYDERRINAALSGKTRSRDGWAARVRALLARPATA
jgi:hypothetical protein